MSFRTKAIGAGVGAAMAIAVPFIAVHEGFRPAAYLDPVGIPTICYGHTAGVVIGQVKTKAECDLLLALEIEDGFAILDRYTDTPLTTEQRVAFASFIYNVGEGSFRRSTMLKKLNAGDVTGACNELPRWVYAKGKKLPGLVKRRDAEKELCLK
ncbi:MAG: glycoside hydrolase family protein [Gammaproteobacteria bacterium]|nr:glycoside hydrolase family protein [Gammaproteobacteria bacterium]